MKKGIAALICLSVMMLGLVSCGNNFDASTYVKSSLDAVQTGDVSDELVSITQETKEDLQSEVDKLRTETEESLLDAMGDEKDNLTDDAKQYISSAVDGLFEKMKYEVAEDFTKDGDDYSVTVKAYPMNCLGEFVDWIQGDFVDEWVSKAASYTSQDKFMKDMYEACFAKLNDMVQNTEYGDAEDITIKVSPNDSGVYEADEADIEQLITVLLGTSQLAGFAD